MVSRPGACRSTISRPRSSTRRPPSACPRRGSAAEARTPGDGVDRIWSPWRMAYIQAAKQQGDEDGCIFCDLPAEGDDERTMILVRGERSFVILNSFPYNPGHLMVAPFRHVGGFVSLEPDELAEIDALVARSIRALEREMAPHGFNLG